MNRTFRIFAAALCAAAPFFLSAPARAAQTASIDLGNGLLLEMVRTPEGLWFGKYEVTQAQWRRIAGSNVSGGREKDQGPAKPVVGVSFREVQTFLSRLNALDAVRRSGLSFRLPTLSEWTIACLAGSRGTWPLGADGREMTLDAGAWYRLRPRNTRDMADALQPVGGKKPNAYGLYDMLGNAEEMTSSTETVYDPFRREHVAAMVYAGGGVNFRPRPEPVQDDFVGPGDDGGQNFRNGARTRRSSADPLNQGGFRLCATGTFLPPPDPNRKNQLVRKDGDTSNEKDSSGVGIALVVVAVIMLFAIAIVFGRSKKQPDPGPDTLGLSRPDPKQGPDTRGLSENGPEQGPEARGLPPEEDKPRQEPAAPEGKSSAAAADPAAEPAPEPALRIRPVDPPSGPDALPAAYPQDGFAQPGISAEPQTESGFRALSVTLAVLVFVIGIVLLSNGHDMNVRRIRGSWGGYFPDAETLREKWTATLVGMILCISSVGALFPLLSFAAWKDCGLRCDKVVADMKQGRSVAPEKLAGSLRGWAAWWTFCGLLLLAGVVFLLLACARSFWFSYFGSVFNQYCFDMEVPAFFVGGIVAFFFGLALFSFLFGAMLRGKAREAERLERIWWMWEGARKAAGSSTPPPHMGGTGTGRFPDPTA